MWFTETPWPPVIICAVVAAVLFAAFAANGRVGALLGMAAAILLACAIVVVEWAVVTDAEEIEASVEGITSAFQRGELEETLEYVSPGSPELHLQITLALNMVDVHDDLRITGLDVEMMGGNVRGIARFRANATASVTGHGSVGHQATRWQTTWQKEGGRWQLIRVQQLDVMSGEVISDFMSRID